MKDILKQLYNGEIYPAEQIVLRSKAYREKLAAAIAVEQGFKDQLPSDMKRIFSDIMKMRNELESMEISHACVEGMRIGGRIATAFHVSAEGEDGTENCEFEP